jgi:hypothetical protein
MRELAKHRLVTVPLGLLVGSIEEDRMDVGVELPHSRYPSSSFLTKRGSAISTAPSSTAP